MKCHHNKDKEKTLDVSRENKASTKGRELGQYQLSQQGTGHLLDSRAKSLCSEGKLL